MINKAEKILKVRKVKPTANRLLVLNYLLEQKEAKSLRDIEEGMVHSERSSIFRTLKTFEQKNVIHRIEDGSGMVKYAVCAEGCNCKPEDLHYHFYCSRCSLTYCLMDMPIPHIELPDNFVMQQANMVIKGICSQCN